MVYSTGDASPHPTALADRNPTVNKKKLLSLVECLGIGGTPPLSSGGWVGTADWTPPWASGGDPLVCVPPPLLGIGGGKLALHPPPSWGSAGTPGALFSFFLRIFHLFFVRIFCSGFSHSVQPQFCQKELFLCSTATNAHPKIHLGFALFWDVFATHPSSVMHFTLKNANFALGCLGGTG